MFRARNILPVLGFLLINALIIGCSSCNKRKGEENEKPLLEKELVAAFSKEYSLTPDQVQRLQHYLQEHKDYGKESAIEEAINDLNKTKANLSATGQPALSTINFMFSAIMPGFPAQNQASAEKILTQLVEMLENIKKQVNL